MKIQFDKKIIESALQKTFRAVSPRSPLPILGYVLIKTGEIGTVSFSTTDLEFGIKCDVKAKVIEEGSVCVPAKIINELVGQIKENEITISQEGDTPLELKTEKLKYHINVRDVDEFPILPTPSEKFFLSIPQTNLKEIIKNAIIAVASVEEQRAALTGVLFSANGTGLTAVSTDGRRLVKVNEPLDEPPEREMSVIIPQRSLREIQNLLNDSEDPAEYTFSEGQVFFKFDGVSVFSRIIDGKFPGYNTVIPVSSKIKLLVDRFKMQDAIKRALIMALDKETPDLLRVEINEESIRITANSIDVGDAYEEVFFQELDGGSIELAMNGKYMLDVLNVMTDDFVWMYMNKKEMPVMLKSPQKENYIFIVMPVRLKKAEEDEFDENNDASVHSYT